MPEATRQLAAIMFTDIVGYTALMGKNEQQALALLHKNREIQKHCIEKYNGKWLKEMGDGTLLSFNTITDAVHCAIEIQKSAEEEPELRLRIGVHLGEVLFEGEDVFGDGVNIASRIEAIAQEGEIVVSEAVYQNIKNQEGIQTEFIKEEQLKNVEEPVKIYRINVQDVVTERVEIVSELKQRNVLRASLVYILTALVLWKVADISIGLLNLPGNTLQFITLALIVFFPIAMLMAWLYERSPQGFIRTSSAASRDNPFTDAQKKPLTSNTFILLLVVTVSALFLIFPQNTLNTVNNSNTAISSDNKSIAVLYFDNMSGDPDQEYFSDGITEEIIAHISKIKDLRVISRTSVRTYKGQPLNVKKIAEELNVSAILEGSFRRSGNQVRITAQLIDTRTDEHIWTEVFDEELSDIFEIQTKVAKMIAEKFEVEITPETELRISQQPTTNMKAYELFLKARSIAFYDRGAGIGTSTYNRDKASTYLREALALDPTFSEALALISQIYEDFYMRGPGNESQLDSAILYANEAIKQNPQSVEGYIAMGLVTDITEGQEAGLEWFKKIYIYDKSLALIELGSRYFSLSNLPEAAKYFMMLMELYPNLIDGYLGMAGIYDALGQDDSVYSYFNKAESIDPNSTDLAGAKSFFHTDRGNVELVREAALKVYGDDTLGFNKEMGIAHIFIKDWLNAERYYRKTNYRDMDVGLVLWKTGRKDSALFYINNSIEFRLQADSRKSKDWTRIYSHSTDLSRLYALVGDHENAFKYLKFTIDRGFHFFKQFKNDPFWDEIRHLEEFIEIEQEFDQRNEEILKELKDNITNGVRPEF